MGCVYFYKLSQGQFNFSDSWAHIMDAHLQSSILKLRPNIEDWHLLCQEKVTLIIYWDECYTHF